MPEERRRTEGGAGGDSMSRREGRDSDGRRFHSRPEREREPSPKRPRRDGKPASGRGSLDVDVEDSRERKHRRRFQDALPVEKSSAADAKVKPDSMHDASDRKVDPHDIKHSSDPIEASRSRSYFQHDERGSAGHGGQSYVHRVANDGRSTSKDQTGDRVEKKEVSDLHRKYDRSKVHADEKNEWKHDGFFELEAKAPVPRKRPAFSEKKVPAEKDSVALPLTGSESRNHHDKQTYGASRWEEKGSNHSRGDKPERSFNRDDKYDRRGDRYLQRNEMHRAEYQPRERAERHGVRETKDRERFNGRYGERKPYRQSGLQVDKWKHDLYDEANRSPTPKNEEDQIAKVEALLAL
ncbi:U1 small nuclear ribonucleoprotein 70 kDa-like isoform X1 [Canna indica]|uniref:U1 small nuclear ribonucleoprotein 70 kDa-like isoform X1 n=1 Tax=Canna indica TaxID=4628 RepID=A0AAQ3K7L3_9LILI|nr:U1 small nuclear ribonucleoprotein 70 kDa-like isoform X1 [Canna indica]